MELVWDRLAERYDELWVQQYSLAPTRGEVLRRIRERNPRRLLDLGCGTGQLIAQIRADLGTECVGVDKSEAMIRAAERKNPGVRFYMHDLSRPLPEELGRERFDVITCTHSLPYYPDKPRVMETVAGLLAPGGTALFVQASVNSLYDRLVMSVVERTAEPAQYLSRQEFLSLAARDFAAEEVFEIREKWFMPSICGFCLKRRGGEG